MAIKESAGKKKRVLNKSALWSIFLERVLRRARRYYVRHGPQCRSDARWRYELAEPKCYAKEQHVLELTKKLMLGSKVLPQLVKEYKRVSREMTTSTRDASVQAQCWNLIESCQVNQ